MSSLKDCVKLFKNFNKRAEADKRKAMRFALLREAREAKRIAKMKIGLELRKRKNNAR